ncbi:peptidase T [Ginsengibacter hankyongi]|uniref:Peptidase T n=2 Tax=Ginsengibacter hankyongi TaxID=2607284 RepID=A0A5J5IPQ6_9BACT|nr:peptidase T [Ginsengibacter hankyongi]
MEIEINKNEIAERFMRYVQIDTQSDPQSNSHPSTEKQKDLSILLVKELIELGITDASMDEYGYVYATIPANSDKENIPVICFCSHVDTAPDCSGTGVKPILHRNYNGEEIILPDDTSQVLSAVTHPYLYKHINEDIITASGKTLLGADDKSGVAAIIQAADFIMQNPSIKHGTIKILFTPDEEVGKGTSKLDMEKLGADFGYTLDGGEAGSLEDETFSADGATIIINGVIAHPGYAKNKLVNAIKVAGEILHALPTTEWAPEATEKKEGFVHPVRMEGNAEKATIEFIVRDFDNDALIKHEERLKSIAEEVVSHYRGASIDFVITEQYRNMKLVLDENPQVAAYAAEAITRAGLDVKTENIRGGTDGSRLSFMGLPCPNIFTGMQCIHSKVEWIGVRDMAKAAETIVHLCMIWEEKN